VTEHAASVTDKLIQAAETLDARAGSNDKFADLVAMSAELLGAARASIMLYVAGEADVPHLRVSASHGMLPTEAYTQLVAHGEGIAGQVAVGGVAVLVEDIADSPYAALARRASSSDRSLMAVPITIDGNIIGVLNVSSPLRTASFNNDDLATLSIVAVFVGKAIQMVRLQNVLNSRFAQIALAQEAAKAVGSRIPGNAYDPGRMAKIVAKSFFREMNQAGFDANQIIQAASEIISQLSDSLHKHSKRLDKDIQDKDM
jgi:L-methionine (R)-S-oxide reductase